jgi:ADP-heptose:LPS heptosyltransferase
MYVLAPCAAGPGKEWPAIRFGRLAALLWKEGAEVVLTAAPGERDKTAAVAAAARASGGEVVDLAGRNSVAQMAALFDLAVGFAGNDSGPTHLAGAMGLPSLGIFVRTDPARYRAIGPRTAAIGGRGSVPEPEEALEALESLVGGGTGRG